MTDAMADCLRNHYDIEEERIHRVPSLFDVEYFDPPQVIGEAASAGLAVFTTRFALGAPHVVIDKVTGAIADTPGDCINQLENLLQNPDELKKMRQRSLDHMRQNFSPAAIVAAFQGGLNCK